MRILVLILATASICACTSQSNVSEQPDDMSLDANRPKVSTNELTLETATTSQENFQYLFLECSPKIKTRFVINYMIKQLGNNLEITSFDSSKNEYVSGDIIYYNDNIREFSWYRSHVSRDITKISFTKNDDYYNVFANIIQTATFDDPDVLNSMVYKIPIFTINRKTGDMSSASYIVANCKTSFDQVSYINKF